MLNIHLLGHVYVTWNAQTVNISSKSAAMLTYLALEKRAHHREHLAELLWDHPHALRNLRVELARLKQQGLTLFPERQPMLSLRCETDLDGLVRAAPTLTEAQVPGWLATVRGTPLSGLDDLCSPTFQSWLDQQRCAVADQLEALFQAVSHRVGQRQVGSVQRSLGQLVQERAQQLGLELEAAPTPATADPRAHFGYPAQQAALGQVLEQAALTPQLVLLHGLSGTKHDFMEDAVRGTAWHTIHIQASPHRRLVQAALLHQVTRLLPHGEAHSSQALLSPTTDADADLIRATQAISAANLPVALCFHGLTQADGWLVNGLRYALDLRLPLLLVVSSASRAVLNDFRQQLGHTDWARLHELNLPPLGIRDTLRALRAAVPVAASAASGMPSGMPGAASAEALHQRAAQMAHHSDGWPLHLRAMLSAPSRPLSPPVSLPDSISQAVLAELPTLPEGVLGGLSVLSLAMDRLSPELADLLLGEQAAEVLAAGLRQGVLRPASLSETVTLPDLVWQHDEAEAHLTFACEHVREALCSRLSGTERHAHLLKLAHAYRTLNPALALLYAERTQLHDLAAEARSRLAPLGRAAPDAFVHTAQAPQGQPTERREVRTGNGYRVALDHGSLEVLRKGRPGPSPALHLEFGDLPPGHWSMTARLDVYEPFQPEYAPGQYALCLSTHGQAEAVYSAEPFYCPDHPTAPRGPVCTGHLPRGAWFTLTGQSSGGPVRLSTAVRHLALTVGEFTWNGTSLLDAEPQSQSAQHYSLV